MILERIIGIANTNVELEFRVMERSLRATGCDVPIDVIPFDDQLFNLPPNSHWWFEPVEWCKLHFSNRILHPFQYRLFLLSCSNFQVADSDLVFLRNPSKVLVDHVGLVTTCHQWKVPQYAASNRTLVKLASMSSMWQARLFNAGQFAIGGEPLYSLDELTRVLSSEEHATFGFDEHPGFDQGGLNYLVALKEPKHVNLTHPPYRMESTWAADYADVDDFDSFWRDQLTTPLLIHWAGAVLYDDLPINQLFVDFMTKDELEQFKEKKRLRQLANLEKYRRQLTFLGRLMFELKRGAKKAVPNLFERAKTWHHG